MFRCKMWNVRESTSVSKGLFTSKVEDCSEIIIIMALFSISTRWLFVCLKITFVK